MSGRVKSRQGGSSAALEQATLSINERILKECHTLYTDADKGVYCVVFLIEEAKFLLFFFSCDDRKSLLLWYHYLTKQLTKRFQNKVDSV